VHCQKPCMRPHVIAVTSGSPTWKPDKAHVLESIQRVQLRPCSFQGHVHKERPCLHTLSLDVASAYLRGEAYRLEAIGNSLKLSRNTNWTWARARVQRCGSRVRARPCIASVRRNGCTVPSPLCTTAAWL
jgi:hypothetical protein